MQVCCIPMEIHDDECKIGIILGVLVLALNASIAYVCVTFVIEAMSASNYLLKRDRGMVEHSVDESTSLNRPLEEETTTLTEKRKKKKKVEELSPGLVSYLANPFSIMER